MSGKKRNKKGQQRILRISDDELDFLFEREFPDDVQKIKNEFPGLQYYGLSINRTIAAILKLSGGDLDKIRRLIKEANTDPRDVVAYAEYPRSMKCDSGELNEEEKEGAYLDDWKEYTEWQNRGK